MLLSINSNKGSLKAMLSICRFVSFHVPTLGSKLINIIAQDLMLRFTLDAASEFLFGSCVHSLSAGLPYPHNVALSSAFADTNHAASANAFAKALLEAEVALADRERTGWIWPLVEIWEDKARQPMQIVDGYIEPIIREALTKQKAGTFHKKSDGGHLEEGETLLDHLVQVTQGEQMEVLLHELITNAP